MGLFDRLLQAGRSPADGSGGDVTKDRERADDLLAEGMRFEQEGRLEEALQRYEAAIDRNSALARAHFNRGNLLLDRGEAKEALEAYRKAVEFKPDSAGAHYNMGNAQLRLGHPEAAVLAYRQAIELKPEFTDALVALGTALEGLGQHDEAIASYRRALELKPDYVEVHFSLGNTLKELKRFDEAAKSYRRALEIKPHMAEVHGNLGNVLRELGQFEGAAASYHRLLEVQPDSAEAYNNLGNAQKDLGSIADALLSYRRALVIKPDFAVACYNIGLCLQKSGAFDQALASYQRAIELAPDYVAAHVNLGAVLREVGQLQSAVTCCRRALEISANDEKAHLVLGNALQDLGQHAEALVNYRRALEIRPDDADAHNNMGAALTSLGQFDEAVASYRLALATQPANADVLLNLGSTLTDLGQFNDALVSTRRALEICPDNALAYSNLLFIYNYLGDRSGSFMLAEARRYGELVARQARPYSAWTNLPNPERSVRVGLVSGDLRNHAVGYFVEGVLAAITSQGAGRVALFAYTSREAEDAISMRIKSRCRGWHLTSGLSDEALARRIHDDEIDILIDLSGHTGHNRLPVFAWKPAPVQVSWLGYFATTGVAAIDYFIADPWTLPKSEEAYFTEKIWRLPETRLCFTPPDIKVDTSLLPALGNACITFGCFNNLSKMNDAVVVLWARVLTAVPESQLFLMAPQLGQATNRQRVVERFAEHGIAADRLVLEGPVPRADYLAAYHRVDIALDPYPYTGGTTTAEALWMGVPVLTLAGEHFLSRQGVGLLMNAGLPEWIARDTDDYVARAVVHANDLQSLAELRGRLRQQVLASPIFDAARFAEHFEAALRGMWQKWCEQNADKQQPIDGA